jgi:hypothetical protein
MIVKLPSGNIKIYFRHTNNGSGMWNYSECHIRDSNNELVAFGQAKCCPLDQFSFAKGRKIALERALGSGLIDFDFSKQERTLIWQKYHDEHNDLV